MKETSTTYTKELVTKIAEEARPYLEKKMEKSWLMGLFWKQASDEVKESLLLSFWKRSMKKHKKVVNMEISHNWLAKGFFHQSYQEQLRKRKMRNAWRLPSFLRGLLRTWGRHTIALRFDHIHLTLDYVDLIPIYGVHWDNHSPNLKIITLIKHLLFEDIRS